MKNNADAIIFHTNICAENVTNIPYPTKETAFADFSCGSSNINVLGMEDNMSVLHLTEENFEKEVLNQDKTVLVDFWSPTCGPCRMLSPIIDEIADERTDVKVCKVNTSEEYKLAIEYNVEMIPTLIVVKGGKVVKRSVGFMPKEDVLKMLG